MKIKHILTILLCLNLTALQSQQIYDSLRCSRKIDSIKQLHPQIKYEGKWQTSFYTALNAYSELQNTPIKFKWQEIKTTMQCRPTPSSVFRKKNKRTFLMIFNHNKGKSRGIHPAELSFNARIGLFAHELTHIIDYQQMSTFEILSLGFRYMSKKGKIALEHKIDRIIIWRGFGHQLLSYSTEVKKNQNITKDYREKRQSIYLQPSEIKELIKIVENIPSNVKR